MPVYSTPVFIQSCVAPPYRGWPCASSRLALNENRSTLDQAFSGCLGICALLLFSISSLYAEELADDEQQAAMPSMDFLEFLGEWETEQGEWLDPETLEDNDITKLLESNIDNEN
jgi:hypothetical protein